MAGIFKAYDIRGIYGDTIGTDVVFRIGRALATFLKCRSVAVGRDMRPHSPDLFRALADGLTLQGADVIDLGLCSTPMSYFATGRLQTGAGVMITASHNPGEWNGLKLSRAGAVPISGDTGIREIEAIVTDQTFDPPAPARGRVTTCDMQPSYGAHIARMADLARPVRIAVDTANAMGAVEARALEGLLDMQILYGELDGTFPNHEANPLKTETLASLQSAVRGGTFDFGVAFDGDADRVGFVDENGDIVPMDIVTALIASDTLSRAKGVILYDLRSSQAVAEAIEENGGTPRKCRVGHAFIKQQMRDEDALFAGELSGHYYFRDNYFTESTAMAVLSIANMVSRGNRSLSRLAAPIRRYAASGEINSTVDDPDAVLERIRMIHADGEQSELDGLSVAYPDWWFNVRKSNTEPLVRLNLEARTADIMESRTAELLEEIRR